MAAEEQAPRSGMDGYLHNISQTSPAVWESFETSEDVEKATQSKKSKHTKKEEKSKPQSTHPQKQRGTMGEIMYNNAAYAFNITSKQFLENLLLLYKDDFVIKQMLGQLDGCLPGPNGEEPKDDSNTPALLFADEASVEVDLPDGNKKSVIDMIIDKDERLATLQHGFAMVNLLKIRERFPTLNKQNRDYIWTTLNQLLKLACIVSTTHNDKDGGVDELIASVMNKTQSMAKKGNVPRNPKAVAKMLAEDKKVQKAARKFTKGAMGADASKIDKKALAEQTAKIISGGAMFANSMYDANSQVPPTSAANPRTESGRCATRKARMQQKLAKHKAESVNAQPSQAADDVALDIEDSSDVFELELNRLKNQHQQQQQQQQEVKPVVSNSKPKKSNDTSDPTNLSF